jgi:hypothetical protein
MCTVVWLSVSNLEPVPASACAVVQCLMVFDGPVCAVLQHLVPCASPAVLCVHYWAALWLFVSYLKIEPVGSSACALVQRLTVLIGPVCAALQHLVPCASPAVLYVQYWTPVWLFVSHLARFCMRSSTPPHGV